jgi:peptide/nickel transport system permease protein
MATVQPMPEETPSVARGPSRGRRLRSSLSILFESRIATVGLFIVIFWLVVGLVSLVWTPYPPNESRFVQNLPPNATNWLGTDHLGRDTLSRLMVGTQVVLLKTRVPVGDRTVSLPIGVAVWGVLSSLALGTVLGQVAGYRRGRWDQAIMQLLDAFVAFPSIVLYLVVIAALGPGDLVVILAIAITGAPGVARLARGLTLDISTRDYCLTPAAPCWWTPCCASATLSSPSARLASWGWACRRPTPTGDRWSTRRGASCFPPPGASSGLRWPFRRWWLG